MRRLKPKGSMLCVAYQAMRSAMLVPEARSSVEAVIMAVTSGRRGWCRIVVSAEMPVESKFAF